MAGFSNRSGSLEPSARKRTARVRCASSGSAASRVILFLFTVVAVAVIVILGISSRRKANAQLSQETRELAIPTLTVVHPKRGAPQQEMILPGDMQPYTDAPIYARTSGYLKSRHVELGARVKAGQLLAEIDTPEVDQQLQQARSDLATVEANLRLAEITSTRYKDLMKTDSVSQQEVDNANGNYEARNTDIGALIDSGSGGGPARELFHIAAVNRLRVYVNVPQVYSPHIKSGLRAELTLAEFPGRHFDGIIVRDAGAIDTATRTLLTEIDVNNPSGELKPGGYVEVHFNLPSAVTTFSLPVNTIIFKSAGMQVATVKDGKTINLVSITPGRDFGTEMEILAGLKGDESVVINPPDSLTNGEPVRVAQAQPAAGGNR